MAQCPICNKEYDIPDEAYPKKTCGDKPCVKAMTKLTRERNTTARQLESTLEADGKNDKVIDDNCCSSVGINLKDDDDDVTLPEQVVDVCIGGQSVTEQCLPTVTKEQIKDMFAPRTLYSDAPLYK